MKERLIYAIDDNPPWVEAIPLGLQHYFTMFGSTVAIPLLLKEPLGLGDLELGWLIGTMFFVSGVTTLLQTTWGNRLPLIQGGTFSFLTPAFSIAGMASVANAGFEVRLQHIQGAVIAGSLFEIFIGYSGLMGRVLRFVGPITIAPTISLIGLALFSIGAPAAGLDWTIGGLTIVLVILFSQIHEENAPRLRAISDHVGHPPRLGYGGGIDRRGRISRRTSLACVDREHSGSFRGSVFPIRFSGALQSSVWRRPSGCSPAISHPWWSR